MKHNDNIPLSVVPRQAQQKVSRTYYLPKASYLQSMSYKRIVGEAIQQQSLNPLKELIREHNPVFYTQLVHSEIDLSEYGLSKHIVNKFLDNRAHMLWYEMIIILRAAGIVIDKISVKNIQDSESVDQKVNELLAKLK